MGTADLYTPGGGGETYTSTGGFQFDPGVDDQALVTRLASGARTIGFTRALPDGSIQVFTEPFGTNQFFLSSVAIRRETGSPLLMTPTCALRDHRRGRRKDHSHIRSGQRYLSR